MGEAFHIAERLPDRRPMPRIAEHTVEPSQRGDGWSWRAGPPEDSSRFDAAWVLTREAFLSAYQRLHFGLVIVPLLLALASIILLRCSNLDVTTAGLFYSESNPHWRFLNSAPCLFVYQAGPLPGLVLAVGGTVVWLYGWLRKNSDHQKYGLYCALVVALGPGLIVNSLLKPHWHRPRPNHIKEFGGQQSFIPMFSIGEPGVDFRYRSFPCGHASMGFSLMALAFVFRKHKPRWAWTFMALALVGGLLIGLTRMAQGKHFASDVAASLVIVYFTALLLHYAMRLHTERRSTGEYPRLLVVDEHKLPRNGVPSQRPQSQAA